MPTFRRFRAAPLVAALLAASLAVAAPGGAQAVTKDARTAAPAAARATARAAAPTLVLLVRHAEKAAEPADDPPLTELGATRARALQAALADAGVQAVVATPRRRTSDTARPLMDALGLAPEIVPLSGDHVKAVADAVRRHAGQVVLVVGHSNTIPAIIGALGGPRLKDLCDAEHSNLFVLTLPAEGAPRLIRSQYGPADPAGAASCAPAGTMR